MLVEFGKMACCLPYHVTRYAMFAGVRLQRHRLCDPAVQRQHGLLLLPRHLQRREVQRMPDWIQRLSSGKENSSPIGADGETLKL